ncbi:MAG: 3-oxoacyl-[acyl-carrier-protein] reductase [Bacillota bacterium]
MELEGKVALITGGSRGIGRAIALAMAREGADIAINYLQHDQRANEVCKEILSYGRKAIAIKADVSSWEQAELLIEKATEEFKKIDILVNNAGITKDNLLLRMKPEDWNTVIASNLTGVFNCSKQVLRPMIKQKWGRIINIASVVGIVGNAGQSNYAAAKAGLIGFTKSLAKEVASRNILVNAIAPGFIMTDMTKDLSANEQEKLLVNIPQGRFGNPNEVASLATFLASDRAGYITGQTIAVDGGMVM